MKQNTTYDPLTKSSSPAANLKFRLATSLDRIVISRLMAERNPGLSEHEVLAKTDREMVLNATDPQYWLYVAEIDAQVVGLCRFFHSEGLPKEKIKYPSPAGWYGVGILVDPKHRRQSIARFLFEKRLECLRDLGAREIYSLVDSENLASIKMHEEFGYADLERAAGFLHVKFESGSGILYRKII